MGQAPLTLTTYKERGREAAQRGACYQRRGNPHDDYYQPELHRSRVPRAVLANRHIRGGATGNTQQRIAEVVQSNETVGAYLVG
jgi:hypothetical protein